MGLLSIFSKPARPLLQLHSGSFSMDRGGHVLAGTLPSSFPRELVEEIGQRIAETFRDAHAIQLPLDELVVYYPGLKITAREMRGGVMVFLSTTFDPSQNPR